MKRKDISSDLVLDLINAFKSIKSTNESVLFLQDILTAGEIKKLAIRLRVAKMLLKDASQRDISFKLRISISTVTKVNSWLNQKGDGFREIIKRLPEKIDLPTTVIRGPVEYHLPQILATSAQYIISKNQTRPAEKLIEYSKEKRFSDKLLKQISDDTYKQKKSHVLP